MEIGIDESANLIYEGREDLGRGVWPTPFIAEARIVPVGSDPIAETRYQTLYEVKFVFREDEFDPRSGIRRGRFYKNDGQQPRNWMVLPHPGNPLEVSYVGKLVPGSKSLATFSSFSLLGEVLSKMLPRQPLVLLGAGDRFTIWTIADVEISVMREEVVVLKARRTFGALPEILEVEIPEARRKTVIEKLEKLSVEIFRAGPESIIDRARDAASAMLGTYVEQKGIAEFKLDLEKLINKIKGMRLNTKDITL